MKRTRLKDKVKKKDKLKKKKKRLISSEGYDVSLKDLERALKIDKHALDEMLERQPDLFYMVARECALRISQRDAAVLELKEVEAIVDQQIRQDLSGEEKVTERDIEARRRTNRDVLGMIAAVSDLNHQVAIWQALKEGWQQRSYVLKDLVTLYVSSYYGDSTKRATDRVKGRDADIARGEMAKERRHRM